MGKHHVSFRETTRDHIFLQLPPTDRLGVCSPATALQQGSLSDPCLSGFPYYSRVRSTFRHVIVPGLAPKCHPATFLPAITPSRFTQTPALYNYAPQLLLSLGVGHCSPVNYRCDRFVSKWQATSSNLRGFHSYLKLRRPQADVPSSFP
jgi:hypothetical protein